ncbi:hypothetical protein [Streptomyces sp. YIM 98790]|uniref:hypothetical protein n=1 Tax=Streptomyces sp. YIM 98790 TaxID=2689077 RepID=UPI00140860DD|nr:hypothetical protein [Streptomyces sp. YIM 98790]
MGGYQPNGRGPDVRAPRWTPPPSPYAPQPPRRMPPRPLALVVTALAAALVTALAFLLIESPWNGDGKAGPAPSGPAPSGSPSPAPSPSASPSPTPSPSEPASGPGASGEADEAATPPPHPLPSRIAYRNVRDPAGFGLAVPDGWERDYVSDLEIFYTPDNREHLIQISVESAAETSPYDNLAGVEQTVSAQFRDYRLLNLSRLDAAPFGPAELEFTYTHPRFGPRYTVDQVFYGADGRRYALLAAGPLSERGKIRELYRRALDSWCLTGCPAG